jgi:hypothetical protein
MDINPTALARHVAKINAILQDVCKVSGPTPLVKEQDLIITTLGYTSASRVVTTDLGGSGFALRLPIPDPGNPNYRVGLYERWESRNRHRICFRQCGLRLYIGGPEEEPIQLLRLEWVAPTIDRDGGFTYDAKHAGHPHWHIDRAALVGPEDSARWLESSIASQPSTHIEAEVFEASTKSPSLGQTRRDFSWVQGMHLPAHAQWMLSEWNGRKIPGPHQCEPSSLVELERWWAGSLRYLLAELPR